MKEKIGERRILILTILKVVLAVSAAAAAASLAAVLRGTLWASSRDGGGMKAWNTAAVGLALPVEGRPAWE